MAPSSDKAILIVDDSADEAMLLTRAFQKVGITNPINVVHSGEDAKAYLAGEKQYSDRGKFPVPAFIVLDVKMPGTGGFAVLEWIKSHPTFKEIVVVVLTGMESIADVHRAYQLGANSFVMKPMTLDGMNGFASAFYQYWIVRNC